MRDRLLKKGKSQVIKYEYLFPVFAEMILGDIWNVFWIIHWWLVWVDALHNSLLSFMLESFSKSTSLAVAFTGEVERKKYQWRFCTNIIVFNPFSMQFVFHRVMPCHCGDKATLYFSDSIQHSGNEIDPSASSSLFRVDARFICFFVSHSMKLNWQLHCPIQSTYLKKNKFNYKKKTIYHSFHTIKCTRL